MYIYYILTGINEHGDLVLIFGDFNLYLVEDAKEDVTRYTKMKIVCLPNDNQSTIDKYLLSAWQPDLTKPIKLTHTH